MAAHDSLPLLTIDTRASRYAVMNSHGPGSFGGPTQSLTTNTTRVEGRKSPEFLELLWSYNIQNCTDLKCSPEFFNNKPSTPLGVESGPRVDVGDVIRRRFACADRARARGVPLFYIPECGADDFCVLQQRFLAAERGGLEEEMDELYKEIIIVFAEHNYRLTTPMGVIETAPGLTTIPPQVEWMLKYSSCFCSSCEGPLKWESTHNEYTNQLTWYSLPCNHAVRFCENCRAGAQCWLCGVTATAKRKHVYQNVRNNGNHKSCMIAPCDICECFN